ncbi:MAG: 16S rRNA processing protein RimM [Desulfobacteraceae bacterium]|nr:16S rRNA processing protein RimM [Desulfobacteraceae bacterium]MBU4002119.1 ribosome maturation factor RimM [Pseudomonadota bacterium]MBU4054659.1 ribosome maturation factor RimM [Pseudomonadota bacterium]
MQKLLPIGKICGVHGIKGNLRVKTYTETSTLFSTGQTLFIKDRAGGINLFEVAWAEPYKQGFRVAFKDVPDRNSAERLVGLDIFIDQDELPELEEGNYYWANLIGMAVWTKDNRLIGHIESIIETGANDVYVVRENQNETLIPAIESVVLEIDLKKNAMTVALPEGL